MRHKNSPIVFSCLKLWLFFFLISKNRNEATKHNDGELKTICFCGIFLFVLNSYFVSRCNPELCQAQVQAKGTDYWSKKINLVSQYASYVFCRSPVVPSWGKVSTSNYFRPVSSWLSAWQSSALVSSWKIRQPPAFFCLLPERSQELLFTPDDLDSLGQWRFLCLPHVVLPRSELILRRKKSE